MTYSQKVSSHFFTHEVISPFCHPDYYPIKDTPHGNFKGPFSLRKRCMLGKMVHEHVFDYFNTFRNAYNNSGPWMAILSFLEAHEGSGENLATMDNSFSDFFASLTTNELENTAIFILSDHGLHMGPFFVFTQNGLIENSNPFLLMFLPKKFLYSHDSESKKSIIEALTHNEQSPLTAFNIHATLECMIQGRSNCFLNHEIIKKSLFEKQDYTHNCDDIGVPSHLCFC
jgi:hypothetical protein